MQSNSQARKFQITINNPEKYNLMKDDILMEITKLSLDYYCMVDEIATTGTRHTHIFIYSSAPIRFSTIKNRFPIAHIEKAYGSVKQNRDYICKEGKWKDTIKAETQIKGSFYEFGDIPTEASEKAPEKTKLLEWVESGMTTSEIIRKNPNYAFRSKDIDMLRETVLSEKYMRDNRTINVTYIYGNTGTGKTSSIYKNYLPCDICRLTTYKSDRVIFDSYHGQDVLVFEEFRSQIPLAEMLSYLDVYPLMLPARYNDRVACYTKVYILSNLPLYMQYVSEQKNEQKTWDAFLRRINTVIEQASPEEQIEKGKEFNPW